MIPIAVKVLVMEAQCQMVAPFTGRFSSRSARPVKALSTTPLRPTRYIPAPTMPSSFAAWAKNRLSSPRPGWTCALRLPGIKEPSRTTERAARRTVRPSARLPAKVRIGPFQPVLPRRTEDIHIERVFQRHRLVGHVGGNQQHLAGAHHQLLRPVGAEGELERTLEDVGQLLVFVLMHRHQAAPLEIHV